MAELMVLLQALLLVAGWLLFLRAQAELRAQAARQSLTGELEDLRHTLEALLTRLMEEADRAEQSIRLLQEMNHSPSPPLASNLQGEPSFPSSCAEEKNPEEAGFPRPESEKTDSGYNLFQQERPAFSAVAQLAQEGLSLSEIARRTGYALGEVELILNLNRRHTSEE